MSSGILVLHYLLSVFIVGFTCSDLPSPKHTSNIFFYKISWKFFIGLNMKIVMNVRGQFTCKWNMPVAWFEDSFFTFISKIKVYFCVLG